MDVHLGGTEKQLVQIIEKLNRKNFEPTLISLSKAPFLDKNVLPCETLCLNIKSLKTINVILSLKKLRKFLIQRQFHLLQTFFEDSIYVCYITTLFMKNKPIMLISKRDIGLGNKKSCFYRSLSLINPIIYNAYKSVVVNGENIKKYLENESKYLKNKVKVINNGISINIEKELIPDIISNQPKNIWIGMTANLNPVKRIDIFIQALALVKNKYNINNFKAIIMGEGPERDKLIQLTTKMNLDSHVHFLGSVRKVYTYLNNMQIAVLCSEREGFSNAILEYMACSLPIIATAVGGNTELVNDNNGIRIPPGNASALAKAIYSLIIDKDLRENLGKNSRRMLENKYSWSRSMAEWESFYQKILIENQM